MAAVAIAVVAVAVVVVAVATRDRLFFVLFKWPWFRGMGTVDAVTSAALSLLRDGDAGGFKGPKMLEAVGGLCRP